MGVVALMLHNPLALTAPAAFMISRAGLAHMLWTKGGADVLIAALKTPTSATNAATVATARVLNAAKRMGVQVEPAAAAVAKAGRATNVVKGNFGAPPMAADEQRPPLPVAQMPPQPTPVGRFLVTEQPNP